MSNLKFYRGKLWHKRISPKLHEFDYSYAWISVNILEHDSKTIDIVPGVEWKNFRHGPRDGSNVGSWLIKNLKEKNISDVKRIELHCLPEVLGFSFTPVCFFFIFNSKDELISVWVEANNTYGQHENYLVKNPDLSPITKDQDFILPKIMLVSPFSQPDGNYIFQFCKEEERVSFSIKLCESGKTEPFFFAVQSGEVCSADWKTVYSLIASTLTLTFSTWARIHYQGWKLWLKGVPHNLPTEEGTSIKFLSFKPKNLKVKSKK